MDLDKLTEAAFSIIKDDDPYKASKQLQIRNWGCGYLEIINTGNLSFFLDILSDEECWEKTSTIHGIKLNRRVAAKKMIEPQSWKGTSNPLEDFYLYQIAFWCCLEEDVITMFEHFKQKHGVKGGDSDALKKLAKRMSGSWYTDAMMQFWSHFISGYVSELDLKGRHPYVFGLHYAAISSNRRRVEAVEFFWDKVKSLPESELSNQEKDEIFMTTAVNVAKDNGYPDVFEFCLSQMNPNKYSEFLKRDLRENRYYASLNRTLETLNFDKFQELFDCFKPSSVSTTNYDVWLYSIKILNYSGPYVHAAAKLFIHIWMKEGFDNHRAFVINEEVMDKSASVYGNLLIRWVKAGCMEPVWMILDKLNSNQIKEFMTYEQADYIRSVLEQRNDNSLNRFLAYSRSIAEDLNQNDTPGPGSDLAELELIKQSSSIKR
ncbi:hypothetical protein [Wolbachia endosymbiont (group B) of Longitarsus flavicornis]|uniref:hypothetical protein n=1 Tax=Wolbachia endosymbiont (group B) of Longitarsus flavicornis TaxID=3066135 RepID=UPI0033403367